MGFRILALVLCLPLCALAQQKKTPPRPPASRPATPTAARDTTPDEQLLVATERRILDAIRERDPKELESWIAEDFAFRNLSGQEMNREQFLQNVKSFPHDLEWLSAENIKVRILGEVAIVTGVQQKRMAPAEAGAVPSANTSSLTSQCAFTDVFRHRGSDWELVLEFCAELPPKPSPR